MSSFRDVRELGSRLQTYNMEIFKEPRGIIRILQLVFAVITAVVLRSYEGYIDITYCDKAHPSTVRFPIEYPFDLGGMSAELSCTLNQTQVKPTLKLSNNFSCEAEFLFEECLISAIYVVIAVFVYVQFREEYESNGNLALLDFIVSVTIAGAWIGCVGYWGYAQSALKTYTQPDSLKTSLHVCNSAFSDFVNCINISRGSVSTLTQTLILSFLNFFLWAAGLWFVYKETPWYLQFQRNSSI